MRSLIECVVNVSEGRDTAVISSLVAAAGPCLLDVHSDPYHHRSVFTVAGAAGDVMEAVQSLSRLAVARLDLAGHDGVHPRLGVLDVVPWVSLEGWPVADGPVLLSVRDEFAAWAGSSLDLPCFLYGPSRSLPSVRRSAFRDLAPDTGPAYPHPTAGACAVGARPVLVAYNLWLAPSSNLAVARSVAAAVRSPSVRALGLQVGSSEVQVSCNLIAPWQTGPGAVFDAVADRVEVARAELVGLVPAGVLAAEPESRWAELALDPSMTIEARLEQAGLDGGRFGSHSS